MTVRTWNVVSLLWVGMAIFYEAAVDRGDVAAFYAGAAIFALGVGSIIKAIEKGKKE